MPNIQWFPGVVIGLVLGYVLCKFLDRRKASA